MLVGREVERRRLDALLAAARLGQSGVLVITGEPGIGKTALLEDARGRATDIQVLTVTGTETERDLPFAGLAQLLRITAADLSRLPAPQADALGVALALEPGDTADRFAVGAGLLTLLAHRSEDVPLCLIIDDAHQLDLPSQDALLFVARRLLADAVAVVVAFRAGEECRFDGTGLPQLTLGGIDPEATAELVRSELAGSGPGGPGSADPGPGDQRLRTIDQVIGLSEGNPLAIRELIADPGALIDPPADLPRPLPDALSRVYARRAAELDTEALTAVLFAAVAGQDLTVIARGCAELGVAVQSLDRAEALGLLTVRPGAVKFRHPLVRSALYSMASPATRRELHAAAARAVGDRDADRRAWHLSEAVVGPDEDTAAAMAEVARRAADRAAYAVAANAAGRAAALSASTATRALHLLQAGSWAWLGGDATSARRLLTTAADLTTDRATRARAQHVLGVMAARSGSMEEARDLLLRAAADGAEPADSLASLAEAADVCFYLGDAVTAVRVAEAIERSLPHGADPQARARGSIAAGCARILAGQDGSDLIRQGIAQLRVDDIGTAEPAIAAWAVIGPLFLRDSGTGAQLAQAVNERRSRSALGELPHLLFHIAREEAATDRWARAAADYAEVISLARELGQGTELAAGLSGLAWLEARRGRAEVATALAQEALELSERHHIHVMEIWARLASADLAYGLGDIETALGRYLEVHARLAELEMRDVDLSPTPEIVDCLLRLGRPGRTVEIAREHAERADAKGQPWARARADRTYAQLADDTDLDAAFALALERHDATLDVFERARTQLAYGGRLRRARRRVDARAVLQPALDTFARLGALPWAEATADELAATGASVARPGENPTTALTPRELQVAMLLTEGRTTRETASALFLSPKTVEYHLRNIYTKLDIASRAELAALVSPPT